ncbi:MAG: hypothetical protein QM667_10210 [Asticcacaulis sp.]
MKYYTCNLNYRRNMELLSMLKFTSISLLLTSLSLPAVAANAVRPGQNGIKFASVLSDAGPVAKTVVIVLCLATLYAIISAIRQSLKPKPVAHGQSFIRALRYGGFLAGAACALFLAMNIVVRVVYSGTVPPFIVWAPGLAEILLVLAFGLIASTTAIFVSPVLSRPQVEA